LAAKTIRTLRHLQDRTAARPPPRGRGGPGRRRPCAV